MGTAQSKKSQEYILWFIDMSVIIEDAGLQLPPRPLALLVHTFLAGVHKVVVQLLICDIWPLIHCYLLFLQPALHGTDFLILGFDFCQKIWVYRKYNASVKNTPQCMTDSKMCHNTIYQYTITSISVSIDFIILLFSYPEYHKKLLYCLTNLP